MTYEHWLNTAIDAKLERLNTLVESLKERYSVITAEGFAVCSKGITELQNARAVYERYKRGDLP